MGTWRNDVKIRPLPWYRASRVASEGQERSLVRVAGDCVRMSACTSVLPPRPHWPLGDWTFSVPRELCTVCSAASTRVTGTVRNALKDVSLWTIPLRTAEGVHGRPSLRKGSWTSDSAPEAVRTRAGALFLFV